MILIIFLLYAWSVAFVLGFCKRRFPEFWSLFDDDASVMPVFVCLFWPLSFISIVLFKFFLKPTFTFAFSFGAGKVKEDLTVDEEAMQEVEDICK